MIDIKLIKDDPKRIEQELDNRNVQDLYVEGKKVSRAKFIKLLVSADTKRRELQLSAEDKQRELNELDRKVSREKDLDERHRLVRSAKPVSHAAQEVGAAYGKAKVKFDNLCKLLPNFHHSSVDIGKDESENVARVPVGKKPTIKEAKQHFEIESLKPLIDLERGAKVASSRFVFLKGPLAQLQYALVNYTMSVLTDRDTLKEIIKKAKLDVPDAPFIPVVPPAMLKTDMLEKLGRLNPAEDKYHLPEDGLSLAGSAEHTIGSMHAGETFPENELPLRYIGYSTSFRREAGSYGKDTRGILRMHQFDKLEMESFTVAEHGEEEQKFLVAIQEYLLGNLGLPYQVVDICTGDMGDPDTKQIDIETWMPGQDKYRETHSADWVSDFQSRSLNIKVERRIGTRELVHMNDATAFAIGRAIIAITENYQRKDGTVDMPEVLHKYLPFTTISTPNQPEA